MCLFLCKYKDIVSEKFPKSKHSHLQKEGESLTAEVMSPEGSNLVLAANVPNIKFDVLVSDSLDVKANSGDSCNILTELELVKNCGFASCVESEHEQTHLLGPKDPAHHLGKLTTHGDDCGLVCSNVLLSGKKRLEDRKFEPCSIESVQAELMIGNGQCVKISGKVKEIFGKTEVAIWCDGGLVHGLSCLSEGSQTPGAIGRIL